MSPEEYVERSQKLMAAAWMVRTFVKHSDEAEDFPEIMGIARAFFDCSRALETRIDDPVAYFKMLRKKLGGMKKAAKQFESDAFAASTHMNFQQATIAASFCTRELEELLERFMLEHAPAPVTPPKVQLPNRPGTGDS